MRLGCMLDSMGCMWTWRAKCKLREIAYQNNVSRTYHGNFPRSHDADTKQQASRRIFNKRHPAHGDVSISEYIQRGATSTHSSME